MTFKTRSIIHVLLTLAASFKLAMSGVGFFEFVALGVPIWCTIYFLTKWTLEPFEKPSVIEQDKSDES